MKGDVVSTARAAEILGCNRSRIIQMIHDKTITTAYMNSADGFTGRPGYKIEVDELYAILEQREQKRNAKREVKNVESSLNKTAIKDALTELQQCLVMMSDTIEKLKNEL